MTSTLAPNYASKNYSFYYAGKLGFFMYVMLVKKTSRAEAKNLFARVNGRWSNSERLTNTYELKKNIDKFTANFSAQALLCKPNAHYQIEKDISLQAHCMCLKRFTEAFCEVEDCFLIDLKRSELGKLVKCYVNTMFNRMGDQAEGLLLQIEQLLLAKFSDDLKLLHGNIN